MFPIYHEVPLVVNERIQSASSIAKRFGVGEVGPMTTAREMTDTLLAAAARVDEFKANYAQKRALIQELYSFQSQTDVIRYISTGLKLLLREQLQTPISQLTRELYLEQISEYILAGELDEGRALAEAFISRFPHTPEARALEEQLG